MKALLAITVGTATIAGWFLVAITAMGIFQHELVKSNNGAKARFARENTITLPSGRSECLKDSSVTTSLEFTPLPFEN